MKNIIAALLLAGVGAAALSPSAFAQKRVRHHTAQLRVAEDLGSSIPLTVNRRSWLDPGNAVSTTQTAGPNYVAQSTFNEQTQDRIFAPDRFGNAEISGQPYVPGRTQPVVEFSSLPNGSTVVDNVLLPQNFYFNPAPALP